MEEKARLEAEAREREEQQLLEERRLRQEEEEAALQKELLRLQELQHQHQHRAAKKKRKEKAKENTAPPQNNPQPLKQTAQNVLDNLHNGKSRLLQTLIHLPDQKEAKFDPAPRPNSLHSLKSGSEKEFPSETNAPHPSAGLHNGTSATSRLEANGKYKAKQPKVTSWEAPAKKELPRSSDLAVKLANGTAPAVVTESKATRIRPAETTATLVATVEPRKEDRSSVRSASGKRQQQQPPTQMKEDRRSPPASNPSPSPPPASQPEQTQQNGKPPSAESPQPKGKTKKNKKKKGDKMNSSIGGSMLRSFVSLAAIITDTFNHNDNYIYIIGKKSISHHKSNRSSKPYSWDLFNRNTNQQSETDCDLTLRKHVARSLIFPSAIFKIEKLH